MIANSHDGPANLYYKIKVGSTEEVHCNGSIAPDSYYYWSKDNLRDGPVELTTYSDQECTTLAKSIASQRVIWGPSFEEVPGFPLSSLADTYHWTWYDQKSAVIAYKQGTPEMPKNVIVSQRVLWKGFFNKTLGTVLP